MTPEIHTPMNGILGVATLFPEAPLVPEQREYLGVIHSSGRALLYLLNDILDLSKVEAGKLNLESIDFSPELCLQDALQFLAPVPHDNPIDICWQIGDDTPPLVCGDPTRVRQILINLVGNALKFTEQGKVSPPAPIATSLGVLVAEDNLMNQRLIARLLEKMGYSVTLAPDGQEAVNLFQEHTFDLVLMDMRMPVMDGLEATRMIRSFESPTGHHVLTANAFDEDRNLCLQAGMDGLLSKPVSPADLRAALERVTSPPSYSPATPDAIPNQASALRLSRLPLFLLGGSL